MTNLWLRLANLWLWAGIVGIVAIVLYAVGTTAFGALGAQEREEWVLAVYVRGDLVFTEVYPSQDDCYYAGAIKMRRYNLSATFRCGLRRTYRLK